MQFLMARRVPSWFLITSVVLLVATTIYLGLANPLNFFVDKTPHFSKEKFLSIEPGMHIDQVIEILGEPLGVEQLSNSSSTTRELSYLFMGDPPSWFIAYEKAWVITDERGVVKARYLYQEP